MYKKNRPKRPVIYSLNLYFLPDQGFTHNLPTHEERDKNSGEDQQFYEMIGKYIGHPPQFS